MSNDNSSISTPKRHKEALKVKKKKNKHGHDLVFPRNTYKRMSHRAGVKYISKDGIIAIDRWLREFLTDINRDLDAQLQGRVKIRSRDVARVFMRRGIPIYGVEH